MNAIPVLSAAIWVPIAFGAFLLLYGNDRNAPTVRVIALVGAMLGLLVTLPLFAGFERGSSEVQFLEQLPWIEMLGADRKSTRLNSSH